MLSPLHGPNRMEAGDQKRLPQQMNGSDCGIFICIFKENLSWRANILDDEIKQLLTEYNKLKKLKHYYISFCFFYYKPC